MANLIRKARALSSSSRHGNDESRPSKEEHFTVPESDPQTIDEVSSKLSQAIFTADKGGSDLQRSFDKIVSPCGWTEKLVKATVVKLRQELNSTSKPGAALDEASKRAGDEARAAGFEEGKELFDTMYGLGILVILAPKAINALGFTEVGPVERSYAVTFEENHAEKLSRDTLYSYFNRLGMKWHS